MSVLLTAALAIVAFSGAGAVFVTDLLAENERPPRGAAIGMGIAAILTALTILLATNERGLESMFSAYAVPAMVALAIAVGHLAVMTRYSARGIGAIAAPLSALLMALFVSDQGVARGAADAMTPVLAVHVGLAVLGLASFALAASVAVLYLVQERQLRQRSFGRLFQRLPSLDALDGANFHLVSVGFILYTVAVVLGVVAVLRSGHLVLDARLSMAIVSWVLFAIVIHTRVTSGWRGRQAAWMSIIGCAASLLILVFYARPPA